MAESGRKPGEPTWMTDCQSERRERGGCGCLAGTETEPGPIGIQSVLSTMLISCPCTRLRDVSPPPETHEISADLIFLPENQQHAFHNGGVQSHRENGVLADEEGDEKLSRPDHHGGNFYMRINDMDVASIKETSKLSSSNGCSANSGEIGVIGRDCQARVGEEVELSEEGKSDILNRLISGGNSGVICKVMDSGLSCTVRWHRRPNETHYHDTGKQKRFELRRLRKPIPVRNYLSHDRYDSRTTGDSLWSTEGPIEYSSGVPSSNRKSLTSFLDVLSPRQYTERPWYMLNHTASPPASTLPTARVLQAKTVELSRLSSMRGSTWVENDVVDDERMFELMLDAPAPQVVNTIDLQGNMPISEEEMLLNFEHGEQGHIDFGRTPSSPRSGMLQTQAPQDYHLAPFEHAEFDERMMSMATYLQAAHAEKSKPEEDYVEREPYTFTVSTETPLPVLHPCPPRPSSLSTSTFILVYIDLHP
eukprot:764286-Hanusia_phi.AAC.1